MSNPPQAKLAYRADIDGLRAVAVMIVVLDHFHFNHVPGGYVGVDVFFVISGYLISAILLRQIAASTFSIASFYERRIRRIVPALLAMLLATCVLSYLYLLPTELEDFAKSLVAATLSVSNFYFWTQAGYFDGPSASKPLLHTWSLAVEEQFYVLFPLFLMLIQRYAPRRLRMAIVGLAAISFGWAAIGAFVQPTATFYLAPTRAWELLMGTMLSMKMLPALTNRIARETASALGLGLILLATAELTSATPFPGAAALLPCAGAGLVIAAGQAGESVVGRLLSLRPMVWLGMISYSIYLWHWPVMVFQTVGGILYGGGVSRTPRLAGLGVSIALGYLSWRWIEVPFRNGVFKLSGAALYRFAASGAAAMLLLAGVTLRSEGFRSRYSPEAMRIASFLKLQAPARQGMCFITSGSHFQDYAADRCLQQAPGESNYLLVGDSHAAHLWYGLSTVFPSTNFLQATATGCRPVVGARQGTDACLKVMDLVYARYLPNHPVDRLLLAGHWLEGDVAGLTRTIAWAQQHGIKVVVFGPAVEYDAALPRLLAVAVSRKDAGFAQRHLVSQSERLDQTMQRMAKDEWHVPYISFYDLLCGSGRCLEYADGQAPMETDASHLTAEGSLLVAQRIDREGLLR